MECIAPEGGYRRRASTHEDAVVDHSRHLARQGRVLQRRLNPLALPAPGGGGHGDLFEREPDRVLNDVREGYVGIERTAEAYGVAIVGDPDRFETLRVDEAATRRLREGKP
jgi:N-methylhydantoinase B/oxoprolinase/acetone carboxylase alpha subunit